MNIAYDLDKYMGSFNFRLSIDGVPQECAKVVSVQSVQAESEMVEYQLGTDRYMRKIPGRSKFSEIEITRVYAGYDQFYNWRMMIEEGVDNLREVKIEILAPDLNTVVRKMVLHNCWPSRWQLPNLDANSNEAAIETITLACERITQSVSEALSVSGGGGTAPPFTPGAGPIGGRGEADEVKNTTEVFDSSKLLEEMKQKRLDALALSKQLGGGPLTNVEKEWAPPAKAEDPTAAKNGGDGDGPVAKSSAHGETMKFEDTGDGEGPVGGQGAAEKVENEKGEGPLSPTQLGFGEAAAADDPTAAKNGGDGDGPKYVGEKEFGGSAAADDPTAAKNGGDGGGPLTKSSADSVKFQEFEDTATGKGPIGGQGEKEEADYGKGEGPLGGQGAKEEADYGKGDGVNYLGEKEFGGSSAFEDPTAGRNGGDGSGPIDPSQKDFGESAAADDPTAGKNGGDGGGPLGGQGAKEEADYGSGSGPLGGQGAKEEADYGSGSGPIDPSQKGFGESAAADDPTAGKNGGDGGGPIGGQGAKEEADYGSGSGPIDPSQKGFGESAAADDPTAGKNGGDGGGPIGGQGEAAAADGGAGSGPIDNERQDFGGSAAADDPTAARNGGGGSGPIGGRGAQAEADYGSPGSGPIGGQGAPEAAE